ncbi:MAG: carboxypeptidase-like regulatory domain-containing protein [Lentimicrobiaceae bacterium]|nr:carboxypeptidase-like regulatory domain-containing protein [Lentimicrobiaceae bacterium]
MSIKHILTCLFIFLLVQATWAQDRVLIHGGIFDINGHSLMGAHIKNLNRYYGTFTDRTGHYSIIMGIGDTLEVSMVGFKTFKKRISANTHAHSYPLNVTLIADTIFLRPTEIKPYPLTYEELKKEFISKHSEEEKYFSRIQTPAVKGPLIIGGPIDFLYSRFSKEARELQKLQSIYNHVAMRNRFMQIISAEVLQIRFNCYTHEDIDDLLNYCGISIKWFNEASAIQVVQRIKTCGYAWKKQQENKLNQGQKMDLEGGR